MENKKIKITEKAQKQEIPNFEIKNILQKQQGQLFHDKKHGSRARVKKKTVIVFEDRVNQKIVKDAYRKNSPTKFSNSRFKQIRKLQV